LLRGLGKGGVDDFDGSRGRNTAIGRESRLSFPDRR